MSNMEPCPSCGTTKYSPTIQIRSGSELKGLPGVVGVAGLVAMKVCSKPGCLAVIGPARSSASEHVAAPVLATVTPDAKPKQVMPPMGLPVATGDYVSILRARLAEVDAKLIDQTNLRAEKKRLQKMLKVVDSAPAPKTDLLEMTQNLLSLQHRGPSN